MPNNKPNNERDYGYYGKGTSGYMHYKQDFDRNFSNNNLGNNDGCFWTIFGPFIIIGILAVLAFVGFLIIMAPTYLLSLLWDFIAGLFN